MRNIEKQRLSNVKRRQGASARRTRSLIALSVVGLVGVGGSSIARAAGTTYTWANPSTGDNNWIPSSTDTNWSTGGSLVTAYPGSSGSADTAWFYAGSGLSNSINLSSGLSIAYLGFNGASTAGSNEASPNDPFTISTSNNSALTFVSGTINWSASAEASGAVTETISAPITVSGGLSLTSSAAYYAGTPVDVILLSGNINLGANNLSASAAYDNNGAASNIAFRISGNISGTGGTVSMSSTNANSTTEVLSGTNSYTGATTIKAGTVALYTGGSLGNTAISFAPYSTTNVGTFEAYAGTTIGSLTNSSASLNASTQTDSLDHTKSIAPNLTFTDSGTPSPINLYGASSSAVLTLNAATLSFSVGGATTAADELIVNGGIGASVASGNLINIVASPGTTSLTPGNYTLIGDSAGGLTSSDFALHTTALTVAGSTYALSLVPDSSGDTVELNIAATPEPASLGLLAFGGLGLMRRRRRLASQA